MYQKQHDLVRQHMDYQVMQMVERKGKTSVLDVPTTYENLVKYKCLLDIEKYVPPAVSPCESERMSTIGKPYEGKLQARFDEGGHCQREIIIIFVWQALLY